MDEDDTAVIIAEDAGINSDRLAATSNYGSVDLRPSMTARPSPSPAISNTTISLSDVEPLGRPIYEKPTEIFEIAHLRSRLTAVASLTMVVFGASFFGALWASSIALVVHSFVWLGLFAKLVFIIFLVQVRSSQASRLVTYRTKKWDLFLCAMSILIVTFGLGGAEYQAIEDLLFEDRQVIRSHIMLIVAIFEFVAALIITLLAYPFLRGAKRNKVPLHESHFSRSDRKRKSQTTASPFAKEKGLILKRTLSHIAPANQQCLLILLLIQSFVAVLGSLLLCIFPFIHGLDTLLGVVFAPLVVAIVVSVTKNVLDVLVEGVLKGLDVGEISERLTEIDGILGVRKLRIWSLSMEKVSVSVTLSIDHFVRARKIRDEATDLLLQVYGIDRLVINVEQEGQPSEPFERGGGGRYSSTIVVR
uniref:Solute carrier family 30 member 8 n=1 Tax=Plectus sambesii TaxID=2011161 RepID=A0A914WAX4_9BILA